MENEPINNTTEDINKSENWVAKRMLLQFVVALIVVGFALAGYGIAGYIILFYLLTGSFYIVKNKTIALNRNVFGGIQKVIVKGTEAVILGILFLIVFVAIFLFFRTNLMELITIPDTSFQYKINFSNLAIGAVLGIFAGYFSNKVGSKFEKVVSDKYGSKVIST